MSLWLPQQSQSLLWSPGHSPADSWPPAKSPSRSQARHQGKSHPVSGRDSTDLLKSVAYSPIRPSKRISALDVSKRFLQAWGTTWRCLMTLPISVGTGIMRAGTVKRRVTLKTDRLERCLDHFQSDFLFRANDRSYIKSDRYARIRIFTEPMGGQASESLLFVHIDCRRR